MQMGIKEFRDRISEVALGDDVVVLTHHGKRVGRFVPDRVFVPKQIDAKAFLAEHEAINRRWRAETPDWQTKLAAIGIPDEEIAELEDADRCS